MSLRDVERAMKVIMWFYSNSELIQRVIKDDDSSRNIDSESSEESSEGESDEDVRGFVRDVEQVRFLKV